MDKQQEQAAANETAGGNLDPQLGAAELPPVEPPSAGFIVQLFVVPALIVLFVVGIWVVFGKLASNKQDLQHLVQELQSGNPQREQRAALELAQLLRADLELGKDGEQLSTNPDLARSLSSMFRESLKRSSPSDEELQQQAFLARTLGFMDVPDLVLPVLIQAIGPSNNLDIRKGAMASIALISGRQLEAGVDTGSREAVLALIEASNDDDYSVRQIAAFSLGLMDGPVAEQQLKVLLANRDRKTAINAALGLARQGSSAGLPLFLTYLAEAADALNEKELKGLTAEEASNLVEQKTRTEPLVLKNTFKALTDLLPDLNEDEKAQVLSAVSPVAEAYPNMSIQIAARKLKLALENDEAS